MRRSHGRVARVCVALVLASSLPSAWAGEGTPVAKAPTVASPEAARETAREAFARGVEHFEASRFEPAARAFLRAEALEPDSDTLSNALVAAQKSGSHLLVVEVARRALARERLDPGLVTRSREALASAARHLALLRLSCRPAPCTIEVDGQRVAETELYVHPGTRRMIARDARGRTANRERVPTVSGEPSTVAHAPVERAPVERLSVVEAGTTYVYQFDLEADERSAEPASKGSSSEPQHRRVTGPTDEVVFFSAAAVTSGLGASVIWSGVDALEAHGRLGTSPSIEENDEVRSRIVRTDVLVGATIATGVFSLAWGLIATDFRFGPPDVGVAVSSESVFGRWGGRF